MPTHNPLLKFLNSLHFAFQAKHLLLQLIQTAQLLHFNVVVGRLVHFVYGAVHQIVRIISQITTISIERGYPATVMWGCRPPTLPYR